MRARTLIALVLVLAAAKIALDHVADADLFWHLRLGLDILGRHQLPTVVERSWTVAGAAYPANDWLAQVVLALAYSAGGFKGVAVFKGLFLGAVAWLAFLVAERRSGGNPRATGLAVGLALFVAATHFIARPLLFGHLCLVLVLLVLEHVASGKPRAALFLPPIFALWINCHGSWVLGFGPIAAALASMLLPLNRGRLSSRNFPEGARFWLLLGTALCVPALFLNPMGPSAVLRPFALVGRGAPLQTVNEWAPVPWSDPSAWLLLALAAATVLACWRSKKPLPIFDLGLALVLLVAALRAARFHSGFAFVAAPLFAEQLSGVLSPKGLTNRKLNAAVAAIAMVLLGGIGLVHVATTELDVRATAPVAAVDRLRREGLQGERGFHYFDWGGYLVFRDVPSYVDGRLEPFLGSGVFERYLAIEEKGDSRFVGEGRCAVGPGEARVPHRRRGREGRLGTPPRGRARRALREALSEATRAAARRPPRHPPTAPRESSRSARPSPSRSGRP
ncbi:MAG: hypothetical protein QM765_28005 [Myxococcales bacterium]